ncbi:MAG TPA: DUF420 domain-containing protein [Pirellulaceae bacterium]|jgi:uncharacterized membrane protein YozB (DUF420 family)|nr:DUF420 domain-containing protein [Pirellulaceae bacterium]
MEPTAAHLLAAWLLPGRGSLMLEAVVIAMLVVTLALAFSIAAARLGKRYRLHRTVQIVLTICLAVTLIAFEADMRFVTDWRALADGSPWYDRGRFSVVDAALAVHLCFAIPAPFVWAATLGLALRRFGRNVAPGPYSRGHRRWGWISATLMGLTTLTGWIFFYLAFVATG